MWRVCCGFMIVSGLASSAFARNDGTQDIIRSTILEFFTPYVGVNDDTKKSIETDLLNTESDSKLFYPPFPRTWIDRWSSEVVETSTTATFDSSKIFNAVTTFAEVVLPVRAIFSGAQLGYKYEHTIKYTYNKQTTLMAMTSWRQSLDPSTTQTPLRLPPGTDPALHSVIDQKSDLRTYFKVSKEYPIIAMCKYEISLNIAKTSTTTLGFLVGSKADGNSIIDGMTYTVYSNFFQIEGNIPIQEYLHVRCGENFAETVRFLVESEFSKLVTEAFAHYHPKSECRWNPNATQKKEGDQDCMKWFENYNYITINKKNVVPRCVLGKEGYPVCVIRTSKIGEHCPVYATRDQISVEEPPSWQRQINPMDYKGFINMRTLYPCDKGLECRLENGRPISDIKFSSDPRERMNQINKASLITTCQQVPQLGGR